MGKLEKLTESKERRLDSIEYSADMPVDVGGSLRVIEGVRYTRCEYERRQTEVLDVDMDAQGGDLYEMWRHEPDMYLKHSGLDVWRGMTRDDRVAKWVEILEKYRETYEFNWGYYSVPDGMKKLDFRKAQKLGYIGERGNLSDMPKLDTDMIYRKCSTSFDASYTKRFNLVSEIQNRYDRFVPYPQQRHFLATNYAEVLYGGARGGGKTGALIIDAALHVRRWSYNEAGSVVVERQSIDYPEYSALILRRTFQDIYRNFKPMCDKVYPKLGGIWREKTQCYTFPSGATIYLGYCDSDDDVGKYIGGNFHYLGIEELNQFPERWIKDIGGSIRTTNPELIPLKRYTTNPGGLGHIWIKKRFIDACPPRRGETIYSKKHDIEYHALQPGEPVTDEDGNVRWFIPALVFDNPALVDNDPNYISMLKSLDPVKKKMWLLGDWDEMSGLFFDTWNPAFHVIHQDEFKIDPDNCRIYRCVDYGTTNPFACMFVQVDKDGRAVVFDEIYKCGLTASAQAKEIYERTLWWKLSEDMIDLTVVDPSMKTSTQDGGHVLKSVIEIYYENGIEHIALGVNARVPGWAVMKDYLQIPDFKEGEEIQRPFLVFTNNCVNCIETIPSLIRSKKDPDDLDTKSEDHCVTGDTLVYTVTGLQQIKDLVGRDGYCFGWNEKEKRMGATKYRNARITRKNAEIWKLTLDDGSVLRATPDHMVMLRNGSYKQLKDLKKGESIMPINTSVDYHGHLNLNLNSGNRRWGAQRVVYEDLVGKIDDPWKQNVHHIDEDKHNNSPENLILMSREDHCRHHAKNRKPETERTKMKRAEATKRKFLREEYRKSNNAFLASIRVKASVWHGSAEGIEWHKKHASDFNFGKPDPVEYECAVCHAKFMAISRAGERYCTNNCRQRAVQRRKQGIAIDSIFGGYEPTGKRGKRNPIWIPYNHKVESVEFCGYEDTYCLTTDFGNFATDKIVIHNCADAIRYLLMFIKLPSFRPQESDEPKWLQELKARAGKTEDVSLATVWAT